MQHFTLVGAIGCAHTEYRTNLIFVLFLKNFKLTLQDIELGGNRLIFESGKQLSTIFNQSFSD